MLFDYREIFCSKMGLPLSARFKHAEEEVARVMREVLEQYPKHTLEEARGRALARLDGRQRSLFREHSGKRPNQSLLLMVPIPP